MRALAFVFALMAAQSAGAACQKTTFENLPYTVCEAHAGDDLRLFLNGPHGAYGGFAGVKASLAKVGMTLEFAMNAGMYQPDLSPVGLYVEDGRQVKPIITSAGPGNFGLLPNGVFCIGGKFSVVESRKFAKKKPACRYASQSGPMLVIAGKEHPQFNPASDSLHVRNGVGVSADGKTAYFVISERAVNFDSFARFFRDALGTPNALYFDGSISRLYAPQLGKSGAGFQIGPMVGLVVPRRN
ncbi:MAG: phosphodiester glycosidase family protein [Paracoccaceae bacterium]